MLFLFFQGKFLLQNVSKSSPQLEQHMIHKYPFHQFLKKKRKIKYKREKKFKKRTQLAIFGVFEKYFVVCSRNIGLSVLI